MSRLPRISGQDGVRLALLPTPRVPPPLAAGLAVGGRALGEATSLLGQRLRQAQRFRKLTEFDVEINDAAAAGEAASKLVDSDLADKTFEAGLADIRQKIDAETDSFVRDRATQTLELQKSRGLERVKEVAFRREQAEFEAAIQTSRDQLSEGVAAGTMTEAEANAALSAKYDAVRGILFTSDQIKAQLEIAANSFRKAAQSGARALVNQGIALSVQSGDKTLSDAAFANALEKGAYNEEQISRLRISRDIKMEAAVQRQILDQVESIERRAVDFEHGNDIGGMASLTEDLADLPQDHPRVRDAKIDLEQRLRSMARKQDGGQQLLLELGDPSNERVAATDDAMDAAIELAAPNSDPALALMLQKIGRVPPSMRDQLDTDGDRDSPNLTRFLSTIEVIESHNAIMADREAEIAGDLGEVAHYATRDVKNEQERLRRVGVLERPNAGEMLDRADLSLGIGGTATEREEAGENPNRMKDAIGTFDVPPSLFDSLFVLPIFGLFPGGPTPRLGPQELSLANNLYRYRYIEQRLLLNVADHNTAAKNAQRQAADDFRGLHRFALTPFGDAIPIPTKLLDLPGQFGEDQAFEQIMSRFAALNVREREINMIPAQGFVEGPRSFIPVASIGTLGFIEWDSTNGTATLVDPSVSPQRFNELIQSYGGAARPDQFRANSDLFRRTADETATLDQERKMAEITRIRYQALHDGDLPTSTEEQQEFERLFDVVRQGFGW